MARRVPEGPPPPPVVQRIRLRYAKRGRLRFTSHRDFARAFERALRRAEVPMAYSAGFSPHPKISYVGAAPTGVASEAEYLEIGLARAVDPAALREALDAVLPDGIDIDEAVEAGPGSLAERMQASAWRIELPGIDAEAAALAVTAFLARDEIPVFRLTKDGRRTLDARAPVLRMIASGAADDAAAGTRAILDLVVRQVTPTVRPDDIVAALREVAGLAPAGPPVAVRLAQGPVDPDGAIGDPLAPDRQHATATS
ncbi:MAG TPA: TIGR03936 family radical SAM-associated protein [Jatrophihabitans sp.]|uniref:TIGR03936 family radical SAM-associated protein n=1 Tax=Jatrophihabitans sp. TaxID=1932789 RepID=UPI002E06F23D|nr:TIGR03936 family radical SAM-associated protein [Jatrophihabitans sp.]